jgi:hypothetical protein
LCKSKRGVSPNPWCWLRLSNGSFATQADLWAQDDDLMNQAYSNLSMPVSQSVNEEDVKGVTIHAACRDVDLPLENLAPTCAGVYGTEELLAGCDHREIFRWFWALPAFLPTKPPELAGMKVAITFGFHASTALRFGYWTSPLETLAHADGTSLSNMTLFWPKKAHSERPIDQYCCNRFRGSIPATAQMPTAAFSVASTVYEDRSWRYRFGRRRINTTGPLRYPGPIKLMAPVSFQYSMADMVSLLPPQCFLHAQLGKPVTELLQASKVPIHFATVVHQCLECLRSQQCIIHAITFPDGNSVSRHYIDSNDSNSLIKLLSAYALAARGGGQGKQGKALTVLHVSRCGVTHFRSFEVCVSVIMLVPLRSGLPDVSVIVQAIGQVRAQEVRWFATPFSGM